MNILFIGGNHKLCIELLYQLLDKNLQFKITILDNQRSLYKENETIQHHFEYLTGDIYTYYYGNIENKELLNNICQKHNIDIIINNVKYNVYKTFEENYNSQIIGNFNVLSIASNLKINKVINITRKYSNNHYHFTKYNNLVSRVSFINMHIKHLSILLGLSEKCYNISYYDNLYYNKYDFSNTLLEKYAYSFKIGNKPYIYNINTHFVSSKSIINAIIKCLNYKEFSLNYNIYGSKVNILNELIPTIINYIKKYNSKLNCSYHIHNNEKQESNPIIFDELNQVIHSSVKNIFE